MLSLVGESRNDDKMDDPDTSRKDDTSTVNKELRRFVLTRVSVVSNKYIMRRILLL
jgi:hypothetical protein